MDEKELDTSLEVPSSDNIINNIDEEETLKAFSSVDDLEFNNDENLNIDELKNSTIEKDNDLKNIIDDDELYAARDKVNFQNDEITIVQQMENVITWEINGLYDNNGKINKKLSLKRNPPVFTISSSDGAVAEFVVTKDMSFQMYKNFETIYKAYFGIDDRKKNIPFKEKVSGNWKNFKNWIKFHPVKFALGTFVSIVFIIVMVIGFIG